MKIAVREPLPQATVEDLLRRHIVDENGCWLWTGWTNALGYPIRTINRVNYRIHRVSYEYHKGSIPHGLVLDHLCRVPRCINPKHLEAVTDQENRRRGMGPAAQNARKTHCVHGHEFTPENTYLDPSKPGERACRECMRRRDHIRGPAKRKKYRTERREHYNAYQRRYRQQRKEQGRPI